MNTSTLTVLERSLEIGTLRAIGYTRRQVTRLFVREMALLAALGLALGLLLATTVSVAVAIANIRVTPPGVPGSLRLLLTPGPVVYAAVGGLLLPLALLVTWGVARRSVRRGTADLLTATRG
jgi:putative ABC transport system permease protein